MDAKQIVLVSNWPVIHDIPESIAKAVSEDTVAGRMYEVYDIDQFIVWCADSTTWVTLWPESDVD